MGNRVAGRRLRKPMVPPALSGFAASLAALALLLATPAAASAAAPEEEAFLAGSLVNLHSGAVMITFRGNEGIHDSEYAASARLLRTPCPGRYEYLLESEAWPDGPSSVDVATIVLSPRQGAHPACGEAPPPRPGSFETTIAGSEAALALSGERFGSGPFTGGAAIGVEPRCDASYTFEARVDLNGWHRDLHYQLDVLRVEVTAQGHDEPRLSCSDAGA